MAEQNPPRPAETDQPAADTAAPSRLRAVLTATIAWAVSHWKRTVAFVATIVLLMSGLGVTWTYMVNLAIESERGKLDEALVALDAGEYDQAGALVRHVLNSGTVPTSEYGTPLFVLGAVKAHEASRNIVPEERRTEYLVASRYLNEARSYGFPANREKQSLLLLGKSLVETGQTEEGVEALISALDAKPRDSQQLDAAIHRLLAEAYTLLPKPNYKRALAQLTHVLESKGLTEEQLVDVLLLKSSILAHLDRHDASLQALASIKESAQNDPKVLAHRGKILVESVAASLDDMPLAPDGELPPQLSTKVDEAIAVLREAQSLSEPTSESARRTLYLLGRAAELRGDQKQSQTYFRQTREQFGDSPEGLAAKLAEADILRQTGNNDDALLWYRQVLQSEIDPLTYRNDVLPIDELRGRTLRAVGDFVRSGLFGHAITMLDSFTPLFTRTQELELRGKTLREWGDHELELSTNDSKRNKQLLHSGLKKLREAGVAFERLATLRFATAKYPSDLWDSADCFYRGRSFSNAARVLDRYLQNEPENRNAEALLRLGQVDLALGRVDDCILSLEECIELYGRDNATYQARIDCAKAYWYSGNPAEAERLLRVNLTESLLEPQSPEWKDSLFTLGLLLFDQARYEDAISTLEEAVERYPHDNQTLLARYVVGEAYRRWAAEPLEWLESARTASDRQKNQQLVDERLSLALRQFKEVQSNITLKVHNAEEDLPYGAMRRNCYMLEGACLFDLGRYQEAIEAYQNVSSLYPNEPFVLETFVQIAHCWQRLDRTENAHGAIEQAQLTLEQLPGDADFAATTAFSREEWRMLLNSMSQW